ncbi:MAG: hypothetical protein D5S00_07465 [Tindallia sp. MSAO_Bac2]|nr:MAG: hypothetical protein D5S00_07465 [Tindallia sp. MSAO_Bac2]
MAYKDQVVCPYCQAPIRIGEDSIICSDCKMPHHRECWLENEKCTTYGCKGRMKPNPMINSHRRQKLPPIEISFEEVEEKTLKNLFFRYQWVIIIGMLFLMGFGYYLLQIYSP